MSTKGFILGILLLLGIFALSISYSAIAGLAVLSLVGTGIGFAYVTQQYRKTDELVQRAEDNDQACADILHQQRLRRSI